MTENEIQERVQNRMDRDEKFRDDLESLIEQGLYDLAKQLIKKVVGVVVDIADSFWLWLKSLFS